jgi:integrase/recombinase XerD
VEAELIVPDNHGGNSNIIRGGSKQRGSWKDNPSNAQVIAAWLAGYGPNTRRTYSEGIKHWQQWCLLYKLDVVHGVERTHIDLWGRWMEEEKGYAVATVHHRLCNLRSFYNFWEVEEIIVKSPARYVSLPQLPSESPTKGVTRTELSAFIAYSAYNASYHALCCLLVLNGLRVSEACNSRIEDLGVERGHRTLTVKRKGGQLQTLPLSPKTHRTINDAVGERTTGPILTTKLGTAMTRHNAYKVTTRIGRKVGIEHSMFPHRCRHAFITTALDAGVPLHDVQDSAGHTDPKTTMRYNRNRYTLDRNATHIVTAFLAGT